MIGNTKTAEWAIHIAVLQAATAALYRAHLATLPASAIKPLNDATAAAARGAVNETALFLSKMPNAPKAASFARELLDNSDALIAALIAEMAADVPAAKT